MIIFCENVRSWKVDDDKDAEEGGRFGLSETKIGNISNLHIIMQHYKTWPPSSPPTCLVINAKIIS